MPDIKPTLDILRDIILDTGGTPYIVEHGFMDGLSTAKYTVVTDSSTDAELAALAAAIDESYGEPDGPGVECVFYFTLGGSIDTPQGRANGEHHLNFCGGCDDDPRHTQEAGPEA